MYPIGVIIKCSVLAVTIFLFINFDDIFFNFFGINANSTAQREKSVHISGQRWRSFPLPIAQCKIKAKRGLLGEVCGPADAALGRNQKKS
jgi:hypothetical protein